MPGLSSNNIDVDVIVIGAGVSGINAAYRIQQRCPPGTTYTILESRDSIGGTWDFWRYPGIRSDSDVFTFSFAWNPWPDMSTLAQGADFKRYLVRSAEMAGIDGHIRLRHTVVSADFVSEGGYWEVRVRNGGGGDEAQHQQSQSVEDVKTDTESWDSSLQVLRSRFIFLGTGYYDYETPLQTVIPGLDQFQGKLIRPQFWPVEYDYADQEMVIIGSGATAISILPAVAKKVKHVTMVQRSPTWYGPVSQYGHVARWLAAVGTPTSIASRINRYRWLVQDQLLISLCSYAPRVARALLGYLTARELPEHVSVEKHFTPRYNPWEQRLCAVMDGDFFRAIRSGQASVVTGHIETVTANSVKMVSGEEVPADVIVAATGIQVKFGGNIRFSVDGEVMDPTKKFAWKASMLQDVPNLVFAFGYQNIAWTLGADCAAQVLIRLMSRLKKQGASMATPRLGPKEAQMQPKPMFSLTSTYIERMMEVFPRGGSGQWRPRASYWADYWAAKWGDMKTGLVVE
ncbi:hypothetical protein E4U21_005645 [Claviceps maximensis]|nr:hypothetical protein E4U21_005645 [Claviceps maximensis]